MTIQEDNQKREASARQLALEFVSAHGFLTSNGANVRCDVSPLKYAPDGKQIVDWVADVVPSRKLLQNDEGVRVRVHLYNDPDHSLAVDGYGFLNWRSGKWIFAPKDWH